MRSKLSLWIICCAALAALAAVAPAWGSLVVSEQFTYADGNLVGHIPPVGGAWTAHSAAGSTPVQVVSGAAVLVQGSGSREDVNTSFTALGAGGRLYAGFDLKVTGGNTVVYFAHFLQGTSTFRDRLFVTTFTGADYTLGISNTAAAPDATWATGLTFGTTYRVVLSYDYDTGATNLWVNPTQETSTSISATPFAATPIAAFAFRQASGNSTQTIDNLDVATTFAEALALTGACCVGDVCTQTTQANCTGTYQGDGTTCTPNPCVPPVTGACCVGQTCTITTQAACTGNYRGDNTTCDPNPCQPGTVVISQVYGGGGNSGAYWKQDFVELFNPGTAAVDLAGWSVQYASATGTTWQVTTLNAFNLQPGQYYLVQEAAGTGGTANLPTPDTTGTIAMAGGAGKVALVSSTAALAGACPTGSPIVDFVGYGTTASCFEGAGPTPAPSNTTSVVRIDGGCTDTNNNNADFVATTGTNNITPHNTASPLNSCTPGACCVDLVCTVTLGVNCLGVFKGPGTVCDPNPCLVPAGSCCFPDFSCQNNLTEAECLALDPNAVWTQGGNCATNCLAPTGSCCFTDTPCLDNVTEANCPAPGVWTLGGTCAGNCFPLGACCVAGVCTLDTKPNCQGLGGVYFGEFTTCDGGCPTYTDVVISQVYPSGGNTGASYKNDFIELFNQGTNPVAIGGWSVQYAPASGASWTTTPIPAGAVILPGQYYLVVEASGGAAGSDLPPADAGPGSLNMGAPAGIVALVNNTTALTTAPATSIVDLVGYGLTVKFYENARAPAGTTAGDSVQRGSDGCTQTHYNAPDFGAGLAFPRNASTRRNPLCNGTFITDGACCHDTICQILTQAGCDAVAGTYQGDGTTCAHNKCAYPTGACCVNTYFCSDQIAQDCAALGGVYEGNGTACSGMGPNPCLTDSTIAQARAIGPGIPTRLANVIVSSTTNLIQATNKNLEVHDATGGMTVFGTIAQVDALLTQIAEGDRITIEGTAADYNGLFELNAPFGYVLDSGFVGVPAAIPVPAAYFATGNPGAEVVESEIVRVGPVTFSATGNFLGQYNYTVTEVATGQTLTVRTATTALDLVGQPIPTGPVYVTGIFSQYDTTPPPDSGYQLLPRHYTDIVAAPSCATLGDVNVDGFVNGLDIDGFVRAKLGLPAQPGENQACANFGTGTLAGDIAAFTTLLLGA